MKKPIPTTPHDRYFREAMSHPAVARELFETFLPQEILSIADLNTLKMEKDSHVDEELQLLETDVLYTVKLNGIEGYFYVLIEHQSSPDPLMPLRLIKYIISIVDHHIKIHGHTAPLPLIYPVILYNGKTPYTHTTDFCKLFATHEDLVRKIFSEPFQVIDLNQLSEETLRDKIWSSILLRCLKYGIKQEDLIQWATPVLENLRIVYEEGGSHFMHSTFRYLSSTSKITDYKAFKQMLHTHLSPNIEENIMQTIADGFREEGRQKGRQEGRQEAMEEFAKYLLREKRYSIAQISKMTGLSLKTLDALDNKIIISH